MHLGRFRNNRSSTTFSFCEHFGLRILIIVKGIAYNYHCAIKRYDSFLSISTETNRIIN